MLYVYIYTKTLKLSSKKSNFNNNSKISYPTRLK